MHHGTSEILTFIEISKIEAVDKEIKRIARTHTERLHQYPNSETNHLLNNSDLVRRLKRTKPHELVQ